MTDTAEIPPEVQTEMDEMDRLSRLPDKKARLIELLGEACNLTCMMEEDAYDEVNHKLYALLTFIKMLPETP